MDNSIEKRKKFIINFIFYAIIAGILYFVFNYLIGWIIPFIIGFALAYVLNTPINWIIEHTFIKSRKFLAYALTLIIAAIIGLIIAGLVYWISSSIAENIHFLPNIFTDETQPTLVELNAWFNSVLDKLPIDVKDQVAALQTNILIKLQNLAINISKSGISILTEFTKKIPAIILAFIFTILATVFTNIDYPKVRNFFMTNIPEKFTILAHNIKVAFVDTIGKYIKAYFKIMTITFLELCIGFYILKIPNFILVAFLISLFDILPVLGAGGILIPWFVFAFISGNIHLGIGLVIIYAIVTLVRHFIEPKIVGDQLQLNPLVTLLSIYLGFIWFGVAGMLIIPMVTNILIKLYTNGQLKAFVNFQRVDFDDEVESNDKK